MIKFHDIHYSTPNGSISDLNSWLDSKGDSISIINIETIVQNNIGARGNNYLKPEYIRVWFKESGN